MKKTVLILLVFVVAVMMAACGNSSSNGASGAGKGKTQASDQGSGTKSQDNKSQSTSSSAKPDVVKVWTYPVHKNYEADLKGLVADFNKKHPNIKIQYEMLSWAEGSKKFDVALNSGNPPDLYFHSVVGQFVNTGLELPIDQYLTPDIKNDFKPGTLDTMKIQGKTYGMPLYQYIWAWGGNKKLLTAAGIDYKKIQQDGWTWSEFRQDAKKLTKKLPDGSTQYGIVTDNSLDFLKLVTHNDGLPGIVNKQGKFIWNDQKLLDSLTFIDNLKKDGSMPKETVALNPQKRTQMFYDGKAAIISKAIPYYDRMIQLRDKDIDAGKIKGQKIDFVLLPVPHAASAKAEATGGGEGYLMFRQKKQQSAQHEKDVFMVMEELSGAKAGNSANELCLPFVRKSQEKLFAGKGLANPENAKAANIMREQMDAPVDLFISTDLAAKVKQYTDQVVTPTYQALLSGSKSPKQAFDELKTKGTQMLGH